MRFRTWWKRAGTRRRLTLDSRGVRRIDRVPLFHRLISIAPSGQEDDLNSLSPFVWSKVAVARPWRLNSELRILHSAFCIRRARPHHVTPQSETPAPLRGATNHRAPLFPVAAASRQPPANLHCPFGAGGRFEFALAIRMQECKILSRETTPALLSFSILHSAFCILHSSGSAASRHSSKLVRNAPDPRPLTPVTSSPSRSSRHRCRTARSSSACASASRSRRGRFRSAC